MHIFLQGPKRTGKSTVIRKTLEILEAEMPLRLGGFFTWNGGEEDPHVYMRPARAGGADGSCRLASYDSVKGGFEVSNDAFERYGTRILGERAGAGLIIMDELGFLESDARAFIQAVSDVLDGDIPVLGVLRLGDVEWHKEIKRNPMVTLYDINIENRDDMPQELAVLLKPMISRAKGGTKPGVGVVTE